MKCGWLWLVLGGAFSIAGCGGGSETEDASLTNASAFEGIYQLTTASENTTSCSAPGPSTFAQLRDQFFVITSSQVFGLKFVVLTSCSSVADCQAKRAALLENRGYTFEYSFTLSSSANATTLTGFEATTGTGQGTQCVGRTYADHVLTVTADHGVHLESRTKNLADQPQDDGFCVVEPAKSKQEAAGKACSRLEVIDGSFLQAN